MDTLKTGIDMQTISSFSGDYSFLSNFYPCEISYQGLTFGSVEHAFQASKTLDVSQKLQIWTTLTPGKAKRLGKRVTLRPDWNLLRLDVMLDLIRLKFAQEPLKELLLNTGSSILIEGNNWNDCFWGVCNGVGENKLGEILMQVRTEINQEQANGRA